MKHQTLIKSLYCENVNPYIHLQDSPFYVNTGLKEWETTGGIPVRGAVSSFGFSGTNAHLVIEEPPEFARPSTDKPDYLIVLSAQSEKQLHQQAERLAVHCEAADFIDCGNLSFTLLMGRKHFDYRLACVVRNRDELVQSLKTWLEKGRAPGLFAAAISKDELEQSALNRIGADCIKSCQTVGADFLENLKTIAELYVKNYRLNFGELFTGGGYRRLSLPTYPFLRERYWVPEAASVATVPGVGAEAMGASAEAVASAVLLLEPHWQEAAAASGPTPEYREHHVLLYGVDVAVSALADHLPGAFCGEGLAHGEDVAAAYEQSVQDLCARLQEILRKSPSEPVLVQAVVPAEGAGALLAGLAGVLKTVRQEHPGVTGQLISVAPNEDAASLAAKLAENARSPQDAEIRYTDGAREVAGWRELAAEPEAGPAQPWRADGVYLITGGLGGLGLIFAREIAEQALGVKLILTGRRELDDAGRQSLRTLEALGARPEYHSVDVTDRAAVEHFLLQIQEDHGGLNGILHAAGILRESLLVKKTADEIEAVIAPKVRGLINLDEASREMGLDWLIGFSSVSVLGNAGSADYAAGNGFLDAYAAYRNDLTTKGERQGRMVSVNWPIWAEGGMVPDEAAVRWVEEQTGLQPLENASGIDGLYRVLGSGLHQAMVLQGVPARIRRLFLPRVAALRPEPDAAAADATSAEIVPTQLADIPATAAADDVGGRLQDKAMHYLKKLLAGVFKLSAERMEADAPLERYGIDSVLIIQLTQRLEEEFGPLPKTLFFEYRTVQALTDYFLASHMERLKELLQIGSASDGEAAGAGAQSQPASQSQPQRRTNGAAQPSVNRTPPHARLERFAAASEIVSRDSVRPRRDIAIIGLAGRYPRARDLAAFWTNLRDGRDCVSEVPAERWDHSRFYDPDKNKTGATYGKWGGFIDGVDEFDPLFFNISPKEAEFMDPQERLFLQCAHAALEDAGYSREALGRQMGLKAGVFVGVGLEEYNLYGAEEQARGRNVAVSSALGSIANRVSYYCNFQGP
ncbi:MAG: SDR family NAD(P)-dependent oxidoreductase, partial [Alphaproteobacteria bacterium]